MALDFDGEGDLVEVVERVDGFAEALVVLVGEVEVVDGLVDGAVVDGLRRLELSIEWESVLLC